MWVQDDQGYWYEWSDEQHSYVCYDDFSETHEESDAFFFLRMLSMSGWPRRTLPTMNRWLR